jgi:hypothetical protein
VLARQTLLGLPTVPLTDLEGLTPGRLENAARSLGKPVIVFLGPFVDEDEDEDKS